MQNFVVIDRPQLNLCPKLYFYRGIGVYDHDFGARPSLNELLPVVEFANLRELQRIVLFLECTGQAFLFWQVPQRLREKLC
jgi:hypothetical protein